MKMRGFRCALSSCAAAALLTSCGGSQVTVGTPSVVAQSKKHSATAGYIYVANSSKVGPGATGEVLVYPLLSNGNVSPVQQISGSDTQLSQVNGIAVNAAGEVYVVDTDTNQIVGFAPGANGDATPNVVIAGTNTGLAWPIGLAIDKQGNLYVATCGATCVSSYPPSSVLEFAAGSNGNVSPVKDISGTQTQLSAANGVAVDASKNIYVSQNNSIAVFSSSSNGNVAPMSYISGSATMLNTPDGIAVDNNGIYAGSCNGAYIERFALNADGNASPLSVIAGHNTQIRSCVDGLAVGRNGVVYGATFEPRIVGFWGLTDGNVRPKMHISGPNTDLEYPVFLFVTPP